MNHYTYKLYNKPPEHINGDESIVAKLKDNYGSDLSYIYFCGTGMWSIEYDAERPYLNGTSYGPFHGPDGPIRPLHDFTEFKKQGDTDARV